MEHVCWQNALHNVYALTSYQNLAGMQECDRANVLRGENRVLCVERSSLVLSMHRCNNLVCIRIVYVFNDLGVSIYSCVLLLHHMTRPGSILEGFRYTYVKVNPARVRIWVISTVTAPNKHISCKSCSSRTGPSVTATMIVRK